MRFIGAEPLQAGVPLVEVRSGGRTFDLHNIGTLLRVDVHLALRTMTSMWSYPAESEDPKGAEELLVLRLTGIAGLSITGEVLDRVEGSASEQLDFLLYREREDGMDELIVELNGGARVSAFAAALEVELRAATAS